MKKLLTIIAAMIMCNAYGEKVVYMVDGAMYETTQCTAKSNITMPTKGAPTKTGFRFIGWKEGSAHDVYDLLATNGTSYTPTSNTTNDTWTATFSWGTVTGKARCSSISGTANCYNNSTGASCTTNANPTTTDTTPNNGVINYSSESDKYCWCKMTYSGGFVDVSSLAWVFDYAYSSASSCTSNCARACGNLVQSYSGFRRAVFGVGGA